MYQITDDELGYFIYMSQQEQNDTDQQADEDIGLITEARNWKVIS